MIPNSISLNILRNGSFYLSLRAIHEYSTRGIAPIAQYEVGFKRRRTEKFSVMMAKGINPSYAVTI